MKARTFRLCAKCVSVVTALATFISSVPVAMAQDAAPAAAVAPDGPDKPLLKQEEIEQLLAPIALYPDDLLTQMLMASTYPIEIVQADRWAKANSSLKGDDLAKALEDQDWDPSVKLLVNFPDTLGVMAEKLDITIKIGDAFIEQQSDVMNAIQVLRNKAYEQGNLKSNDQQVIDVQPAPPPAPVVVNQAAPQVIIVAAPPQVITIAPSNPSVVYVPTYSPTVVYGAWPYPYYPPPVYYPPYPPGYVASAGLYFGLGIACGVAWGYA